LLPNNTLLPLRWPRLEILANGVPLAGAIEAEVTSNNHYSADRFYARLALGSDPGAGAFWTEASEIILDIRFGFDAGKGFVSVIQGAVDTVVIDPVRRLVRLEGRDRTASLIETRTQESFSNHTASEIAIMLAERHGLEQMVTPTVTPVGRYYQNEHDRITLDQFGREMTEWDLLVWLARQEDFDVFVRGMTLHFEPATQNPRIHPITLNDVMDLRLERTLTLSRDIEVTVRSWNMRQRNAFMQTARAGRSGVLGAEFGAQFKSTPQRVVLVRPNLTPDQALKLAQTTLAQLMSHRMVVSLTMPGELSLMPGDGIVLDGTITGFDQLYRIDEVTRRLSMHHGFIQHLRARSNGGSNDTAPLETRTPG